jgi:hypothetical protein
VTRLNSDQTAQHFPSSAESLATGVERLERASESSMIENPSTKKEPPSLAVL